MEVLQSAIAVYRAQDRVQAHLVAARLDAAGVAAWVDPHAFQIGAVRQPALGFDPPWRLDSPSVLVDSAQVHRARELLDRMGHP